MTKKHKLNNIVSGRVSRRSALIGGVSALAAPAILRSGLAYAANPVIKIGHVSPRSGPLAGFGEADPYTLSAIEKIFADEN